jgi:hypothetical protein
VNNKNDNVILTIGDAIVVHNSGGFVAKRIFELAAEHTNFVTYVSGEVQEHRNDYLGLGPEWAEACESFCLTYRSAKAWFRRKEPQRVRRMLDRANAGLRELDPRFGIMTLEVLEKQPELVYIGLVQKLVQQEAKELITRHHRHYLVVQQMEGVAA